MTRRSFITIIRARSFWKIDRRRGNYRLPNGDTLSNYVEHLIWSQLGIDHLGIDIHGNMHEIAAGADGLMTIFMPFGDDEYTTEDDQERRVKILAREIVG